MRAPATTPIANRNTNPCTGPRVLFRNRKVAFILRITAQLLDS